MTGSNYPIIQSFLCRRQVLSLLGAASAGALIPAVAAPMESKVLAWTPGPTVPQIALALQNHLWEEQSLRLSAIAFPTGREAMEALLGGGADFAAFAEFPVVTGALQGQKFSVLASLSVFIGNRIIINQACGAKSISDLAGHTVGVTLGTNMQYLASRALKNVKVQYVNVAPGDLVPALLRRDIDAAFLFDTFFPAAKAVLAANYIEIMTPEYEGQFVVAASQAVVADSPAAIGAFLAGLLKADERIDDVAAAAGAVSASTSGALSVKAAVAGWSNYRFRLDLNPQLLPLLVDEGVWLNSTGLVMKPATPELFRPYIADAYLAKLAPTRASL